MWSPSLVKNIIKLGREKRQALKCILNDNVSPYHEGCKSYLSCLCAAVEKLSTCVFDTATFMVNYFVTTIVILS